MRLLVYLVIVLLLCVPGARSWAQTFPVKPVTLVVADREASTASALAGLLAPTLAGQLRQPVELEILGSPLDPRRYAGLLQAPGDGYTLILAPSSSLDALSRATGRTNRLGRATFVGAVGQTPYVLVVPADSPVRSVADLLRPTDRARVVASWRQDARSLANVQTLVSLLPRGASIVQLDRGEWLGAMRSGRADAGILPLPLLSQLSAGERPRVLAITGSDRSPSLPDVPTMVEVGLKGEFMGEWYVVLAPEGVPAATAKTLSEVLGHAVRVARPQLAERRIEPLDLKARDFAAFVDQSMVQSVSDTGHPTCRSGRCYCAATRECRNPPCDNC